jgi:sortase family protein
LFVSINKYHPKDLKPNEIGNYCIVGHYYENGKMFGKLHKLKNGDKAKLTDLSGNTVTYQVYDKKVIEPTDVSCTSQMLARDMQIRELTLITCTNGGKQRLVVKLREV